MAKKPKILLIPNVPNWAFDNNAKQLKKRLEKFYDFDIKYHDYFKENKKVNLKKYDCIFLFFWPALDLILKHLTPEEAQDKLITGVFSYNSWAGRKRYAQSQFKRCRGLIINNKKIASLFKSSNYETFFIPKLVDDDLFYYKKTKSPASDKLVVGWVGNPNHAGRNYKGYWNILLPVCQKNNSWIELQTAFQKNNFIAHDKMNDFYNSIDVLVCVSRGETGPNTVLEAGLCKRAVVSTKVGVVAEIIKNNYSGLIIKRNKKSLEKALKKLYDNRKLIDAMGDNLRRKIIKERIFKKNIKIYKKIFNKITQVK
ncbi:MAG: glycosyltransferase [Candidatus Buchananbacteria bacterium]|nr:glycosyltransferase [Candidatus Buchananbacteria bacterium]